jgi:hypothetical protein
VRVAALAEAWWRAILESVTVDNWISAVSAAATVAAVVVALFFSLRAETRTVASEEKRAFDERRTQAIQVAAWLTMGRGDGPEARILTLRNGSAGLVYRIVVTHARDDIDFKPLIIDALPPKQEVPIGVPAYFGEPYTSPFVTSFTDEAGRRWQRGPDGALREMPIRD